MEFICLSRALRLTSAELSTSNMREKKNLLTN
ncbi:MAG: hypothetical protein ACI83B_004073, partial [Sediminicola sp.]